jgi:hypothetical protein
MKRTIIVTLAIGALVITTVTTWRASTRVRATAESLRTLQAQQMQRANTVLRTRRNLEAAQKTNETLQDQLHSLTKSSGSPSPVPMQPQSPSIVPDTPLLQNLQAAARRNQFGITYGPLYRKLGLAPEQIERFEQNLLHREQQQSDLSVASAIDERPLRENTAYQKLSIQAEADYQAAQKAVLGDSGAQQLREYERTVAARESVTGMSAAVAMAGLPFTTTQAEQLAQIIANASADYRKGGAVNLYAVNWSAVHEQARGILSDSQLTFIETSEASGPRNAGSKFLPKLQAAIAAAAKQEPSDR